MGIPYHEQLRRADGWIDTDRAGMVDDVLRLGLLGAARAAAAEAASREADGDERWIGVTAQAFEASLAARARWRVEPYGAAGTEPDGEPKDCWSLSAAREEVRRRFGVRRLSAARRWDGTTGDDREDRGVVEGWHEHPNREGCGGCVIRVVLS